MDAIHSAGVFGWIKQPGVDLVHVQARKPSVGGSLTQHSAAMSVPFHSGNWMMSDDEIGEQAASSSGEQV